MIKWIKDKFQELKRWFSIVNSKLLSIDGEKPHLGEEKDGKNK
jgi:hypothetical protein